MQRKLTAAVTLSMILAAGCKESAWTPMGSAEFVLSEIKLGGATTVSRRIDSDENFGRSVLNGIATGDSLWLEVASQLQPASAAAEASMSIALAEALTRSPQSVLRVLGDKYAVSEVCGMPFLKADSGEVIAYHAAAIGALQRIRAGSLASKRDACRTALDEARERRLERINPAYIVKNKPVAPVRRTRRRVSKSKPKVSAPDTAVKVTPRDTSSLN
ncbi:MAG: hypothetical protein ACJ78K_10710 [Gemmatimonadaceae bacterium]